MSLLGLDIGTSGCKATVFSTEGRVLAQASAEYPLHASPNGQSELDAELVWRKAAGCIRKANKALEDDPVTAMALSVLGEAVVAVGEDGVALAPSPVSFDGRAHAQARAMADAFGAEAIYATTGQPIHPMYSIHKIAWWRDERPELFARAWKFLCFGDFLLAKLGLEPTIDFSMAARTQAFDMNAKRWAPEILEWTGVAAERLATPAPAGTVVGTLPPSIARGLGFLQPVQAIVGGHDQPCGALGSGALGDGEAMLALGTTAVLVPALRAPLHALAADGFPCYPHVLPERWVTLAGTPSGGSLLRWYRDQFGDRELRVARKTGRSVYDVMMDLLSDGPGPLMLLPHFAGTEAPYHNPDARGALFGLTLGTTRAHVVQAIVEGIAYEICLYAERLQAAGVVLSSLRAIGGGARSARWMQRNADVLNLPITVPQVTEATGLGAALLAGWGSGCYDSLAEAAAATARNRSAEQTFVPDPTRADQYARRMEQYRQLYPAVSAIQVHEQE
jgi:xylulokinase